MVKKRTRKPEEEEEEFGPPPFDEKEFYSGELETAKATIFAAVWGVLVALVSAATFAATGEFVYGAAVGVLALIAIRPLLDRFRIVTRPMGTTKWLGTFFSYLMTWLAIWILLVNPPVMDLSPPGIKDTTPDPQELGSQLRLTFSITENSGISSLSATVQRPDRTEETLTGFEHVSGRTYRLDLNYTATGTYSYVVRVEDTTGRSATLSGRTEIVPSEPPTIELISPTNGSDISYDTPIWLHVKDNALISGVYYTLDSDPGRTNLKTVKRYESYESNNTNDNIYRIRPKDSANKWPGGTHLVNVFAEDAAGNLVNVTYTYVLK